MNLEEAIEQLKELRSHCESMIESGDPWRKDAEAIDFIIEFAGVNRLTVIKNRLKFLLEERDGTSDIYKRKIIEEYAELEQEYNRISLLLEDCF